MSIFPAGYPRAASKSNFIDPGDFAKSFWKSRNLSSKRFLAAGRELFKFLDGSHGYFSQLLKNAGDENRFPLVYINACRETEDWPFELAVQGEQFLVPTAVHLVRCVAQRGANSIPVPENRPLKLLFMACSALGVFPELDFEEEEETIFKVTEKLAIDLEVEDSGSLVGLKNKLALEKYDIVHLTGHAGIDEKGMAFFIMEDETGYRRDVSAEELYHDALIENMPRLVFLSGCRTGETRQGDETVDEAGLEVLAKKIELTENLERLCVSSFRNNNYLIVLDDFEQNLEGGKSEQLSKAFAGGPGGRFSRKEPPWPPEAAFKLLPEAAQLLIVLLQKLVLGGKMTQLIITCRYGFELEFRGVDLAAERLEKVYLASFLPAEQAKKVSELRFIYGFPAVEVRQKLVAAGFGNPRLMGWLDLLVKEMGQAEVGVLLDKVRDKKEEFIKEHVLRELLRKGGVEFGRLLGMLSVYRVPVLKEGVKAMAEKGEKELCHRAGMEYFQWLKREKEKKKLYNPVVVEELIYHALGSGEEDIAADEGGGLVGDLTDRLAFMEAQRVGEWILQEKKKGLSKGSDAKLLNELGYLYWALGDQKKAIGYFEQALVIDEKVHGKEDPSVAKGLNNLGAAFRNLGEANKAIDYYNQALAIVRKAYGEEHPHVAASLNNLGSVYFELGKKDLARPYFEKALAILTHFFDNEHPYIKGVKEWLDLCR